MREGLWRICTRDPVAARHAMPLLLWGSFSGDVIRELARMVPAVRELLAEFFANIDAERHGFADSTAMDEAVRSYYARYPVDAALFAELERALRDAPGELARVIGAGAVKHEPREAPKKGETRAGPLARFALASGSGGDSRRK